LVVAAALLAFHYVPALALDKPKGPVLLTITGAIEVTNAPGAAEFDAEMLQALPGRATTTGTPWTQGKPTYEGPLLRSILDAVGARGDTLKVGALNDYSADIPIEDIQSYDVILAVTKDGQPISIRDKGPLIVVYPFDEEPSLYTERY